MVDEAPSTSEPTCGPTVKGLLSRVFPFWFSFDASMCLVESGPSFQKLFPALVPGAELRATLDLVRPEVEYSFSAWVSAQDRIFILRALGGRVTLRGQVHGAEGKGEALFLGAPWILRPEEFERLGLALDDFSLTDSTMEFVQLYHSESVALSESRSLAKRLREQGKDLEAANRTLTAQNATLQDIEQSLREVLAREKAILESAHDAILTIDEKGTVVACNPSTSTLFGYSSGELVGENVALLVPEPHASRHDGYIRAYLETGQAKVIGRGREVLGLRKDGTVFPLELTVGEVTLGDRRLFTGIVRDITKRKRAEGEAQAALAELESSRATLGAALNQLRVGTVVLHPGGQILFLNDACPLQAGLARDAAVGKLWFDAIPFDETSRGILRRQLEAPEPSRSRQALSVTLRSGARFWLEGDVRDYPGDPDRRILYLYDISELHDLKRELSRSKYGGLVGGGEAMQSLFQSIREVSAGDWTVVIEGETGAGKELVARAIHAASARQQGPFVGVNCAGLTESLLTSQLFGHVRGAFTGAVSDQPGLFEAASGGTLFLDEIGDIPPSTQSALLRVLQEKEIVRVGEVRPRKVDARILAATHRDLAREAEEGRFRKDLLFRIRVARVRVPPLRERLEDIPLLVATFLGESRVSAGKAVAAVAPDAERCLMRYPWPGNVRELKSAIDYAVIHCRGPVVRSSDLPPEVTAAAGIASPASGAVTVGGGALPAGDERFQIEEALRLCSGHRGKAAALLGMGRATLYRKMEALGIEKKHTAPRPPKKG